MICERCRRRFGILGENYWNAQGGICPICLDTANASSFFITTHKEEKTE